MKPFVDAFREHFHSIPEATAEFRPLSAAAVSSLGSNRIAIVAQQDPNSLALITKSDAGKNNPQVKDAVHS